MKRTSFRRALVPGIAALVLGLAACAGDADGDASADGEGLSGSIAIDGSSTVTPHTVPATELFMQENPDVRIAVATSGTGGGFEKFCAGETDISMASRQISDEEIALCEEAGIEYTEIGVANDGLAVAVNPDNDWVDCITVDQLNQFWGPDSTATNWADVDGSWPDEPITLVGPGSDSGTYDYFTEAINGEEGVITANYTDIGEDDNAAIQTVAGEVNAMGYVPLSFIEESGGAVKAIAVENEAGECVEPSIETVQDASYNPLGRQLFVYPKGEALERPEVVAFMEFYIENQVEIAEEALFIPLTDEQAAEAQAKVDELSGN